MKKNNYLKKRCIEDLGYTVYQCHSSNSYFVVNSGTNTRYHSMFDRICEADPYFYQLCGEGLDNLASFNNSTLCGDYICKPPPMPEKVLYHYSIPPNMACQRQPCDSRPCWITPVCTNLDLSGAACIDLLGPETAVRLKTGLEVAHSSLCNGKCDVHFRCEDEAECGGYLYGRFCYEGGKPNPNYVNPSTICDGVKSHLCQNGDDEFICPNVTDLPWTEKCESFTTSYVSELLLLLRVWLA